MNKQKALYWTTTGLFSLWMLANAYAYLFSDEAKRICMHFGFPGYFRVELAIAKIAGVMVMFLPMKQLRLREWAYSGFVITVISGFIAHLFSGDGLLSAASALIALVILLISYFSYHNLNKTQ